MEMISSTVLLHSKHDSHISECLSMSNFIIMLSSVIQNAHMRKLQCFLACESTPSYADRKMSLRLIFTTNLIEVRLRRRSANEREERVGYLRSECSPRTQPVPSTRSSSFVTIALFSSHPLPHHLYPPLLR